MTRTDEHHGKDNYSFDITWRAARGIFKLLEGFSKFLSAKIEDYKVRV